MDINALMSGLGPLQESLKKNDADRANTTFEGTAGGGAVKVRLSGMLTVGGVTIAPAAATAAGGDVGMLEDLVAAALGDALRQFRTRYGVTSDEQMQKMLAGKDVSSLLGGLLGG
jgi:nucleoid-associated protein EbfC